MPTNTFKIIFLIGWIALETIRAPHRKRNRRDRHQQQIKDSRLQGAEWLWLLLGFLGMHVLPLLFIFFGWPEFANYTLPDWAGWLGAVVMVVAVWLLWRGHADLGTNWSPTLEVRQEHSLVTNGVYQHIRHPIYAAVWLTGIAQVLLLHNWVAGFALLLTFLPIYLARVPREEQMMLDNFGDDYRRYKERTGGVIPRLRR